jgi:hypothetical protein
MKVYVDELPKSCVDCPCYDCEWGDCNLEDINLMSTNDFSRYEQRHQDCPLHSLAEHDKAKDHQIELLNKGWEKLKEYVKADYLKEDCWKNEDVVEDQENLLDIIEVIEKTYFEVAGNFKKGTIEVDDL